MITTGLRRLCLKDNRQMRVMFVCRYCEFEFFYFLMKFVAEWCTCDLLIWKKVQDGLTKASQFGMPIKLSLSGNWRGNSDKLSCPWSLLVMMIDRPKQYPLQRTKIFRLHVRNSWMKELSSFDGDHKDCWVVFVVSTYWMLWVADARNNYRIFGCQKRLWPKSEALSRNGLGWIGGRLEK